MNNKNGKRKPNRKGLYFIIVFLGLLIMTPGIVACVYLIINKISLANMIKIDLLSILSLIVTVWAGLNIANYFDKKEYEVFKEKTESDINNMKEELRNEANDNKKAMNVELDIIRENIVDNFLEQFLNALLNTEEDVMSSYFYQQYSCTIPNKDIPYGKLISIENQFCQVFRLYRIQKHQNIHPVVIKGVEIIDSIESIILDNLTKGYLEFRKAEFLFYDGKTNNDLKDSITFLNSAEKMYFSSSEIFGIHVDKFIDDKTKPSYLDTNDSKKLSAYYANTIGEIYRRYYDICGKSESLHRAKFYYFCSSAWSGDGYEREVYYRNYGVLIEMTDEGDKLINAKKQYNKAMKTRDFSENLLHCIISISDKIINKKLNIPSAKPDVDRDIKLSSQQYMLSLNSLTKDDYLEIYKELNELQINSLLTISNISHSHDGYLYLAIYYRDMFIVKKSQGEEINDYLDKAEIEINIAKKIYPCHNLVRIIDRDIQDLKSIT